MLKLVVDDDAPENIPDGEEVDVTDGDRRARDRDSREGGVWLRHTIAVMVTTRIETAMVVGSKR
tara:strand:+ start:336 stop:527 length:192 start_codon:yes stop_codon:yes gene_type:complete